MADALPALLTVEEAARVLRIGRTKAYAMAQEWRATGGTSGLPVIDLGGVLRVPVGELQRVFGLDLSTATLGEPPTVVAAPASSAVADAEVRPLPTARRRARRNATTNTRERADAQLDLFTRATR